MEGMPAVAQNFVAEGEFLQGSIFRASCGCDTEECDIPSDATYPASFHGVNYAKHPYGEG